MNRKIAISILMASNLLFAATDQKEKFHSTLNDNDKVMVASAVSIDLVSERDKLKSFQEIKGEFLTENSPKVPEYAPPSTISYYPIIYSNQVDLAPFKIHGNIFVGYKPWFVRYSRAVNHCILNSRLLLKEGYIARGHDMDGVDLSKRDKVFAFDYCTSDFKGFNIFLWRTGDHMFKFLNFESEVSNRVRSFFKIQ